MTNHAPTSFMLRVGDSIAGKYTITRLLGQGGMGIVALATHEALSLDVAIKFLTMSHDPGARSRFAREGRAAAKLQGRHTTKVMDVGNLEDGTPYMVMEYLRGSDLGDVLAQRGPLPIGEVMEYMLQVCDGLGEAHAAGIVHRDLKPANLFLCHESDGRPLVKILDFGISKIENGTQDFALTSATAVLGSPLYMSPEQLRASRSVDARSDVWSLGVVMYELLTGAVPFNASAITELAIRVASEPAPALVLTRRDVPEALAQAIHRCLEKNPEARFASTYELAVAIEPFAKLTSTGSRSARIVGNPNAGKMQQSGSNSLGSSAAQAWGQTQEAPDLAPQASAARSASAASVANSKSSGSAVKWLLALPLVAALSVGGVVVKRRFASNPEPLPSSRIELPPMSEPPPSARATPIEPVPSALPSDRVLLPQGAPSVSSKPTPKTAQTSGTVQAPPKGKPTQSSQALPGDRN
jgi:eukaryotic-like serine/threonine-protein kinase